MPVLTNADNLCLGAIPVNRVYAGATKVWPPNYLNAEVSTASSPDPGPLPSQCVFVWRAQGTNTALGSLCSQYEADPQRAWLIRRNNASGRMTVNLVVDGTSANAPSMSTVSAPASIPPTATPEVLAVAIDHAVASCRMWRTNVAGVLVADASAGTMAPVAPFDSNTVIRIGSFAAASTPWIGRIYWVELRTGLDPRAGTLIWRFDASEYRSGTTFTDARGRVWTLTNSGNGLVVP